MRQNILLCATLFLGGCNTLYNGGGQPLAQMTFKHVKPYPVYTASYEPVTYIQSKDSLPEGFVADPAKLAYDYLNSRFQAAGSSGKLRLIIKDASVNHELVKSKNKMGSIIGVDSSDHYFVRLVIKLELYGSGEDEVKETTLTVYRNIYISEHVSMVEREEAQMQALDRLMDDLDNSIRKILKDNFSVL